MGEGEKDIIFLIFLIVQFLTILLYEIVKDPYDQCKCWRELNLRNYIDFVLYFGDPWSCKEVTLNALRSRSRSHMTYLTSG